MSSVTFDFAAANLPNATRMVRSTALAYKRKISYHLLYILSFLRWEDRSVTFVGCPLIFGPIVWLLTFVWYVMGVCGYFVLIFMNGALHISCHRQGDMSLFKSPFQTDSTI